MHITEGALSNTPEGIAILVGGTLLSGAATAYALWRMEPEEVPRVALLSAAFFVATLIHVPVGPAHVHLVLNGLIGLLLGWAALPAILVGLLLQAIFFGYGGLTTLGINTFTMAAPALICCALFRSALGTKNLLWIFVLGLVVGAAAIVLSAMILAAALIFSAPGLRPMAFLHLGTSGILSIVEGVVTGSALVFLRQVKPELLGHSDMIRPAEAEMPASAP